MKRSGWLRLILGAIALGVVCARAEDGGMPGPRRSGALSELERQRIAQLSILVEFDLKQCYLSKASDADRTIMIEWISGLALRNAQRGVDAGFSEKEGAHASSKRALAVFHRMIADDCRGQMQSLERYSGEMVSEKAAELFAGAAHMMILPKGRAAAVGAALLRSEVFESKTGGGR